MLYADHYTRLCTANTPRAAIAECGTEAQRQVLIDDPDWGVRAAVAEYGTDAQRQALIADENWYVRVAIAQYGTDAQRQALIDDENWRVRAAVERKTIDVRSSPARAGMKPVAWCHEIRRGGKVSDARITCRRSPPRHGDGMQLFGAPCDGGVHQGRGLCRGLLPERR